MLSAPDICIEMNLKLEQYTKRAEDQTRRILRLLDMLRGKAGKLRRRRVNRNGWARKSGTPATLYMHPKSAKRTTTLNVTDFCLLCQRFGIAISTDTAVEVFVLKNLRTDGKLSLHEFCHAFLAKDYCSVNRVWMSKLQEKQAAEQHKHKALSSALKELPTHISKTSRYAWSTDKIATILRTKIQQMTHTHDQIRMLLRILGHSQHLAACQSSAMKRSGSPVHDHPPVAHNITISLLDFRRMCQGLGLIVDDKQAKTIFRDYQMPVDGTLKVYAFVRQFLNHHEDSLSPIPIYADAEWEYSGLNQQSRPKPMNSTGNACALGHY